MAKSYGQKAWELGQIMIAMNDEDAYYASGWLYIWPDGETREECEDDFNDKESYEELEKTFIDIYSDEDYHEGGLYTKLPEVIEWAHEWDKKLELEPIEVLQ